MPTDLKGTTLGDAYHAAAHAAKGATPGEWQHGILSSMGFPTAEEDTNGDAVLDDVDDATWADEFDGLEDSGVFEEPSDAEQEAEDLEGGSSCIEGAM